MSADNFLIIGHTGFIGSHIFKKFKKHSKKVKGISTSQIDLTKKRSSEKISKITNENTIIIVAAAITREKGDTLESMNMHINMISNIAKSLEQKRIKKCIFLSTTDIYGIPNKLPITENTQISPLTYYATAKFSGEKILATAARRSNSSFLVTRFNGVYGPGQKNVGYGPNAFISSLLKNKRVELWGKGEELRDNLFVPDLASAIFALYKHNATGVYNIATGKSISFAQMVRVLKKVTKINFEVVNKERNQPSFDQVFDISKFLNTVSEFSFTNILSAYKKTYDQAH